MEKNYIELQQYLIGLRQDMSPVFFHLAEILKYQVFELCAQKETGNFLIPYMMNDALEYYLILKSARMTGSYLPDREVISAQL